MAQRARSWKGGGHGDRAGWAGRQVQPAQGPGQALSWVLGGSWVTLAGSAPADRCSLRSHSLWRAVAGGALLSRSLGSGGHLGFPDTQCLSRCSPGGSEPGAWRSSPSPSPLCLVPGSPCTQGPRTSEAWSCPWAGSCCQSAFPGRGGGRGVGRVPDAPSQRPSGASGWSQRPGGHRGRAQGATLRLEKPLGFHPEN